MEAGDMQVLPLCWCQWEEDKEMLAAVGPGRSPGEGLGSRGSVVLALQRDASDWRNPCRHGCGRNWRSKVMHWGSEGGTQCFSLKGKAKLSLGA